MSIEISIFTISIFSDQFRLNNTALILTVLVIILAILGCILYYCVCRKKHCRSKRKEKPQINLESEHNLDEFQTIAVDNDSDE